MAYPYRRIERSVTTISLVAALLVPAVSLGADPTATLRLAVAEGEGGRTDPYVRALIEEVSERTAGSVGLDPIWQAGGADFEEGVARLLASGEVDLALTGAKGLPAAGVTSLDALLTPYLITDDALASAVAAGPIADDMLASMGHGLTGMAMWPADLNHPVAFETCTEPLVTPEAFQGLTVRAIPNWIITATHEALGAKTLFVDDWQEYVDRCEVQAAESSYRRFLPHFPTITGDVTFSPRYHVLLANSTSFESLAIAQQAALRAAAIAVRDRAIAELPGDAEGAAEWCAGGGRVVLAGAEALEAFRIAAEPVVERLRTDPFTAAQIDRIAELKELTEPAPAAEACEPTVAASTLPPAEGFSADSIPDGTYRLTITERELLDAGASVRYAGPNAATWTIMIDGTTWAATGQRGSHLERCSGYLEPVETPAQRFVLTADNGCGFEVDVVWTLVPEGIEFRLLALGGDPDHPGLPDERRLMERVWTRID
jgi:TRAP-type C4-dicarboxylate transport system substrate-binding protein